MANDYNFDPEEVPDEAVELFKTYVRNEMEAAESLQELAEKYDINVINQSATLVYDSAMKNIEDPDRERMMYVMLARVGQNIGSKSMVETAKENLEGMTAGE